MLHGPGGESSGGNDKVQAPAAAPPPATEWRRQQGLPATSTIRATVHCGDVAASPLHGADCVPAGAGRSEAI